MKKIKEWQLLSLKDGLPNIGIVQCPIYLWNPSAGATGFPSPADDYSESSLDLVEHLKANKESTFFVKAIGDSMVGDSIHDGDILVVNRSLKPVNGSIVICVYQGELLVKKLQMELDSVSLVSSNPAYKPIEVPEVSELVIWGVVQHIVISVVKEKRGGKNVRSSRRK